MCAKGPVRVWFRTHVTNGWRPVQITIAEMAASRTPEPGDFIMVGGKNRPSLTAEVREGAHNQFYWQEGGKSVTLDKGRFNWYGRDPQWKDELGFRGSQELEKPTGEWNRSEVICDRDTIKNIVNGKVMNYATNSSHTFGKIQLQSEGAEIWIRLVELQPLKH